MNICHVNLASGFSGGEQQTLELIKEQLAHGNKLTVVARLNTPFSRAIEKLDCHLVLTKHFINQHVKKSTRNIDIMHAHEGRAIYWCLIQSILFNVPYIITRRIDNPLKRKFYSIFAYEKASAVVGVSNKITEFLRQRHPKQSTFRVPDAFVSYPKETDEILAIKTRFSDKYIVIQASNLLKHKGHETTLDAAAILLGKEPNNIQIVILGDGPERDRLEMIKEENQLSNVTFAGKQTSMGNWFAAADLFIHPSYSEGLGSVILEAIKAELPVIATDAGGIPDIIEDQITGLLIEPHSALQLSDAILQLEKNTVLQEKLIKGSKEKLVKFSISKISQSYLKIYEAASHQA